MALRHSEELIQVWRLEAYEGEHPRCRYRVEFLDGEIYICVFDTAYDSDNCGELDIEMDDPRYDEFHQVVLEIIESQHPGSRPYNQWLTLDYRDWPARIVDIDRDVIVYPLQ